MNRSLTKPFGCLLPVLCALALAAPSPGQVIQLKGGEVLVGIVDDPHEGGLTFRRLDSGGVLTLTWDQLSTDSQRRLKSLAGLALDEEGEVMVTADHLRYELPGGVVEEVVGRVVQQDERGLTVRRQGMDYPIQRAHIKYRSTREVPAFDIYTRAEFYNEQLGEHSPGEDADKHIRLADVLTRVRDYDHAAYHLERADELGGGRQPALLAGKIERLKRFRGAARERAHLDEIKVALARGNFAVAVEQIEAFEQRFAKGKLRSEFEVLRKRVQSARERRLIAKINELWHKSAFALARKRATEDQLSWNAAKEYAESEMGREIRSRIAKRLQIEAAELDALWAKRLESAAAPRPLRYSYGVGSWTLGSQAILKDTVQGEAETGEQKTEGQREIERVANRIRRAQERARRALARQRGSEAQEDTPEQWWEDASADEKMVWLRAYYAEFGGDLQLKSAHLTTCLTCAGEGRLTVFAQSGKSQKVKCTTCHGTRFKRYIKAH